MGENDNPKMSRSERLRLIAFRNVQERKRPSVNDIDKNKVSKNMKEQEKEITINQTKSSFTITLDIIRNLLIIAITIYLLIIIWKWNWIVAIICSIPIYVIIMNIIGFISLPLYYLTPEHRKSKQVLGVESEITSSEEINKNSIQERLAKIPKEEKAKRMLLIKRRLQKENEFSPMEFSEENFEYAKKCFENLIENNQNNKDSYCKSYKCLKYSKTSMELAFEYLLDSIKFDPGSPIYKNSDFEDTLREMHIRMLITYVKDEKNIIPKELPKQMPFLAERKIDIGQNQLEITKLINWRNNEQWKYFLEKFGSESELGKVCLKKMTT